MSLFLPNCRIKTSMELIDLDEDTLIYILSFLDTFEILAARSVSPLIWQYVMLMSLRQTCKRLYALTKQRIVWTNACLRWIIGRNYPFPSVPLDSLSAHDLEHHVCRSTKLATKWLSNDWAPRRTWSTSAAANTSITDARLLPGSQGTRLFTFSKSVWSAVTLWELEPVISRASGEQCTFNKSCEWSPRGAIFSGFALSSIPSSEVKLAISMLNNGYADSYIRSGIWCTIRCRFR